jgi:hypothetical protein
MVRALTGIGVVFLLVVTACSSESDAGDACDQAAGTAGVCEEGTVCGWPSDKARHLACIPSCFEDDHCPKDYDCKEAVDKASVKGCRFKD